MKFIGITLLIFIILSSCGGSRNELKSPETGQVWQLIKVDSIQVPFLGTPRLDDVDPKNRKVVFVQSGPDEEELFVANFDGQILHSFVAHGNTRVGYLNLMAPLQFGKEGSTLIAFGVPHIKQISLDGEVVDILYSGNIPYYSSSPSPSNELQMRDEKIFYNNRMNEQELRWNRADFFKELRLIGYYDLTKKEKNNFLKFPDESIYTSGRIFPHSDWVSHFAFSDGHLNVVFNGEPAVFVFGANPPFPFIKKIELDLKEFQFSQGVPEGERVPDFMETMITMGKMNSIKFYDSKILVFYSSGFTTQQLKTWATASSPEERSEMINKFRRETPDRVQVLDNEYNLLADFPILPHILPSDIFEREGFLWAKKHNPEEEEDFFTIYKLALVQADPVTVKN
ncbi:hypothetical protein [Algoriphagus resistens]|uniref:hypothetical protein n=1 Tax=Algoriphagus resistens TaxID=1750590 RepID=UPI0007167E92|nr:hypothetical protein [Algoriphagus resistens]